MSTFWQIVVPILAFGVGILMGWLLWRWRRKTLSLEEWEAAASRTSDAEARVIDLRDQRDGLAKEVTSLTSDLSSSRTRLTEIQRLEASASGRVGTLEREVDSKAERVKELTQALQMSEEARAGLKSDLDGRTSTVQRLTAELDAARSEAAAVPDLQAELEGATADLQKVRTELVAATTQLETATSQLATTEADLAASNARVAELAAEIEAARSETAAAHQATGDLESRLREPDARIGTLATAADQADEADARVRDLASRIAEVEERNGAAAWQHGSTALGTPGAAHRDDLKVVNGIGPKMERVLNDLGITAWEQLAALTPDQIAQVTEAISTFSGRIERDEWVSQAADLVRRFPDPSNRPTRETYLNRSDDTDPWT